VAPARSRSTWPRVQSASRAILRRSRRGWRARAEHAPLPAGRLVVSASLLSSSRLAVTCPGAPSARFVFTTERAAWGDELRGPPGTGLRGASRQREGAARSKAIRSPGRPAG
jgi:hypothetical protein